MILVCPTAFKGTLSATAAAAAMADGARRGAPDHAVVVRPLADGGNGTLDALAAAEGGRGRGARVRGPLGTSVTARFLVQETRAVVETAEACGLHLVPEPLRDPLRTSTRGVGQLLMAAAEAVPSDGTLVIGLGGSATVDAGTGMLSALGWRFLGDDDEPLPPGGGALPRLARIERPESPPTLPDLVVLADVTNPLVGGDGAARVYGPQKGAGAREVEALERGLERWAVVVEEVTGRDVSELAGGGAAGGLGAAFGAFLGADPRFGSGWILDAVGFDRLLEGARVVVTGEGRWDAQSSSMGKATGEVIRRSRGAGVPVLLVTGQAVEPVPEGVTLVDGGRGSGAPLVDETRLRDLVSESLPGLLPGARRA